MQESLSSSAHTFCKILYCETNQDGGNVNNAIHVVFALNGWKSLDIREKGNRQVLKGASTLLSGFRRLQAT